MKTFSRGTCRSSARFKDGKLIWDFAGGTTSTDSDEVAAMLIEAGAVLVSDTTEATEKTVTKAKRKTRARTSTKAKTVADSASEAADSEDPLVAMASKSVEEIAAYALEKYGKVISTDQSVDEALIELQIIANQAV